MASVLHFRRVQRLTQDFVDCLIKKVASKTYKLGNALYQTSSGWGFFPFFDFKNCSKSKSGLIRSFNITWIKKSYHQYFLSIMWIWMLKSQIVKYFYGNTPDGENGQKRLSTSLQAFSFYLLPLICLSISLSQSFFHSLPFKIYLSKSFFTLSSQCSLYNFSFVIFPSPSFFHCLSFEILS